MRVVWSPVCFIFTVQLLLYRPSLFPVHGIISLFCYLLDKVAAP